MRTRQLIAAAAVGVIAASGLSAAPAWADPQCQRGQVCFYRGGSLIAIRPPMADVVCSTGGAAPWDMVRNYSSVYQWSYADGVCRQGPRLIPPGATVSALGKHYSYSG